MQVFYHGLSNLRYPNKQKELAAAKRSLFYLWWKYLRLSEDYWWLCFFNGKSKDKAFNQTYQKFGNIFECSFDSWWKKTGTNLFAYKLEPPKVEWLDTGKFYGQSEECYKVLLIPKNLTKSQIATQVRKVLETHKKQPLSKHIRYDISISDTRGMKRPVLEKMFEVWCLNQVLQVALIHGVLDRPERFTQYWIGKQLSVMKAGTKENFINIESQAKHQLAVRVKVNRYLGKSKALIANAEYGRFPEVKKVSSQNRWTEEQLNQIKSRLKGENWISPEIDQAKFKKILGLKN